MTAKKKKFIFPAVVAIVLVALVIGIAWGNTALELNTYTISSSKLPQSFDGYRIAHVSDLHNTEMGKDNEKLLAMLRDAAPDMIAITGDLVDSRNTDIEVALQFVREAVKIAPCYYVTGNHEARISEYDELKEAMEAAGVTVLKDAQTEISLTERRTSGLNCSLKAMKFTHSGLSNIRAACSSNASFSSSDFDAFAWLCFPINESSC